MEVVETLNWKMVDEKTVVDDAGLGRSMASITVMALSTVSETASSMQHGKVLLRSFHYIDATSAIIPSNVSSRLCLPEFSQERKQT